MARTCCHDTQPTTGSLGWWQAGTPRREARRSLPASLGWMLDSFDVMLYALVLPALMRDLGSMDAPTAGLLGSVTLLAAAAGGVIFGVDRRPVRPHARADGERDRSTPSSRRRAASRRPSRSSRSSASCSASAWAASGPAARRWCRRPGRPSIAARRSGSCRAHGRSATARPPSSPRSCCRVGLARGVLRRHPAGALHDLGPAPRQGAGDLAGQRRTAPPLDASAGQPHVCTRHFARSPSR